MLAPPGDGEVPGAGDLAAGSVGEGKLRDVALKGGSYLAVREALGMLIRLGGVVAVTRLIGPHQYGIYVGAVAVTTLVASVSQLGAEVWLIRQPEDPPREVYQQCFSTLLVVSLVVVGAALLLSWPAGLLVSNSREILVFRVLLVSVPVNILWAPAQAKIERQFQFRRMAWLEIGGDIALYGTAVPLAFAGLGVWAPTFGFIAWQSTLFVGSAALAGLPPRWRWSWSVARSVVSNGVTYSSNNWIDRVTALANPVIVGSLIGATGVGLVGLAIRLADTAGFALRVSWRLGLSTISRIQDQPERLRRAMEDGLLAQTFALGAPMAVLAFAAPWVVPFVFGRAWAAAAAVYGLLALSQMLTSLILPQETLLFARGRNGRVAAALSARLVLLGALTFAMVHADGILGYGWAAVMSCASGLVIDLAVRPEVGFSYRRCLPALVGFGVPMFAPLAPWPYRAVLCAPVLLVLLGGTRRSLAGYVRVGISAFAPRGRAA